MVFHTQLERTHRLLLHMRGRGPAPACHTTRVTGSSGRGRPAWRQTAPQLPGPRRLRAARCAGRCTAAACQRWPYQALKPVAAACRCLAWLVEASTNHQLLRHSCLSREVASSVWRHQRQRQPKKQQQIGPRTMQSWALFLRLYGCSGHNGLEQADMPLLRRCQHRFLQQMHRLKCHQ